MLLLRRTVLVLTALALPASLRGASPPVQKVIAAGADSPTAAQFREHVAEFEKLPLDGTVILPTRRLADNGEVAAHGVMTPEPWLPAEFEPMIAELKAAAPRRAQDNFLLVTAGPGAVDWFDDTAWREVTDHWRLLARAAKQGGLRGLMFDPGAPTPASTTFHFMRQPLRAKHDFAAHAKEARERGRAVMQAIAGEFPECVLFSRRLVSDLLPLLGTGADPTELLATHPFGLLPAFVDGWLDSVPAKALIVEGNEAAGFRADGAAAFDHAYARLKGQARAFFALENRPKFRAQLLVGHGLLLDAYTAAKGAPEAIDPRGASPAVRLEANLSAALAASDGWVWLAGQDARWWPAAEGAPAAAREAPLWPVRLAGIGTAISRARQPVQMARETLAAAKPEDNRLRNGNFATVGDENLPASWWTHQAETSRGTASRDATANDGAAAWSGAESAAFGQSVPVKAGETWLVGVRVKKTGNGTAVLGVAWKDAKQKWVAAERDVELPPDGPPDADGWRSVAGTVTVPPGAVEMVVMPSVRGQLLKEDKVCFDDAVALPRPN